MNALYKLFECSTDATFGMSPDGSIRYWNDSFPRLLGLTAEEVRGKTCFDLLCGRDLEGNKVCNSNCQIPKQATVGFRGHDFDLVVNNKQGESIWLNIGSYYVPSELKSVANGVSVFFSLRPVSGHRLLRRLASESRYEHASSRSHSMLTTRETQVLGMTAEGGNTTEIANKLSISTSTVKNHFKNIFAKLEVHSRAEAVSYAMQHCLI
jgi:PAS domain S-box-containing protein